MKTLFNSALRMFLVLTLLTGVIYPLFVTGISQFLFPQAASGSLIYKENKVVGSELIGQHFSSAKYFWGRPSATPQKPYNSMASGGSNQGSNNPELINAVNSRIQILRDADPQNTKLIPIDLVTASASGLDPHISPHAAHYQASRVARIRRIELRKVKELIDQHTEGRQFFIFGEPRVNVLKLNLALDNGQVE